MKTSMNRAIVLLALATLSAAPAALGAKIVQRPLIITSSDHSLVLADDCAHFHTQNFTSFPAKAQSEEQRDVTMSGIGLLHVRASEDGGVSIRGWDKATTRLTVCKYAGGLTQSQATATLGLVAVSYRGGEIAASGPEINQSQVWWVHMILRVPRAANLDVASSNGGIAIRNMNGRVTARAKNGGISIASCAGENKVATENGGITLDKITGPVDAQTQNGPISVKLRDVTVPALEAQTAEAGEILCKLTVCDDALSAWNANRKHLRIGRTGPTIRLSTTTAPITIEQVQ
jgi:DUF4097 and DUF4098 domain-containing protein YvlB